MTSTFVRYGGSDDVYWRPQVFRDGLRVRYEGVVHEFATWDYPYTDVDSRATTASNLVALVRATWIRRSMRVTPTCCWPRANATPTMRGRSST